jgi:hypothetical protein
MMFVLIASVLSWVAHTKKLLASEKTDHTLWHGRAKNKVRGRDGALQEFDSPALLYINIKHRSRPWILVKPPIDPRYAVCKYVVLI